MLCLPQCGDLSKLSQKGGGNDDRADTVKNNVADCAGHGDAENGLLMDAASSRRIFGAVAMAHLTVSMVAFPRRAVLSCIDLIPRSSSKD